MFEEEKLTSILTKVFGFHSFKCDEQKAAILEFCKRKNDVFVLMPTGGGKSLCYQLPGVHFHGVTIVVSPLIALIHDQLEHLNKLNIVARSLNSRLKKSERDELITDLQKKIPDTKFLYITPEQTATPTFQAIVKSLNSRKLLAALIIDEAHCVSQWGHDFRPHYLQLGNVRNSFPSVPCMALTATASKQVVTDVIQLLKLKQPVEYRTSVFRSNIIYEVSMKDLIDKPEKHLAEFIEDSLHIKYENKKPVKWTGCGLIYCRKRETCDKIAKDLQLCNVPAKAYHAGLKEKERSIVQNDWSENRVPVIVATISFGMGVDKPDVRCVVHWNLPMSMAAYYQESGRAGRDGKLSNCRIYFSSEDCKLASFLLTQELSQKKEKEGNTERFKSHEKAVKFSFESLVDFCQKAQCRHWSIARYFGDDRPACSGHCDFCKDPISAEETAKRQRNYQAWQGMGMSRAEASKLSQRGKGSKIDDSDDEEEFIGLKKHSKKNFGFDRRDDDDEDDDAGHLNLEYSDKNVKNARMSLIQQQFALRKAAAQKRPSSSNGSFSGFKPASSFIKKRKFT